MPGALQDNLLEIVGLVQGATLFSLLFYTTFTDVTKHRIGNMPCLIAVMVGLVCSYLRGGVGRVTLETGLAEQVSLMSSLGGLSFLFILFFLAYMAGGLGAGDAKLVAAVGALVNFRFAFMASVYIAISGMGLAVILLVLKGDFRGGVWRGIRAALTFRYRSGAIVPNSESATSSPAMSEAQADAGTGAADAGTDAADAGTDAAGASGLTIPYAVAVLLGVVWTSLFYIGRAPLPFLPE